MKISLAEARRIALQAQGLASARPFGPGPAGALSAIQHLGYVQIDTIAVIERAHHHVLWTRVPDYTPAVLSALVAERKVFEYWSHAASYLPFTEYRYCLPRMQLLASGHRHWFKRNSQVMKTVLSRITAEGPLMAKDFEPPPGHKSGSWFEWKPAKRALEQLFMEGTLMVRERRGFQKVFDLRERVLPSWVDTSTPSPEEMARFLIRQTLRSHGIATEPEMRYLRKGAQAAVRSALREMVESGEISVLQVHEIDEKFYAFSSPLPASEAAPRLVRLLSPFDNLVIQRKRLKRLFGFDYQVECYVPEAKRKYGYFCLPILWGDELVGRIDAKADRQAGKLLVHETHYEPGFSRRKEIQPALREELARFAQFNGVGWDFGPS